MQDMPEDLQAELEALRLTKRRFDTLMSNLPGMVYCCRNDDNWAIEFVSEGCHALTGHRPEEVIGASLKWYAQMIHPADREAAWGEIQPALRERRPFEVTYRLLTATGEEKWVWHQGQGVFRSDGRLVSVEGFIVDLTWHRRTEEALERSLERYRGLYDAMPGGIVIISRDDEVLDVNDTACEMLGVSREELIAEGYRPCRWQAIHADGSVCRPDARPSQMTLRTGRPVRGAVAGIRSGLADGTRWLLINTEPVLDPADGSLRAVVVALTDITAQKTAEEALRRSETRYRTLAEAAQDLIFIVGPDDVVQYVNTHAAAVLGLRVEDLIGKPHSEFAPADVAQRQREHQRRVFETGEPLRVEAPVPVAGRDVWLETHLTPLKDDEGRVTAVLGVARDVTERRRSQEALCASEQRYRTLAETARDVIFIIGPDDVVQYLNRYGAEELGLAPEDIIGRTRAAFLPADVNRRQRRYLRRVFDTGEPVSLDDRIERGGRETFYETRLTPLKDDQGNTIAVMGVARDVTERRCADEALRASEERYRTLAETAQDFIFIIGPDDVVQYVNPSGVAPFGLTPADIIGRPRAEFVRPETNRRHQDYLRRVFETGEPAQLDDVIEYAGHQVLFDTRLTPLKDDEGRVTAVLGVSRDVTRRRRALEALRASEERYRTLAETAHDSIFIIGSDDVVQYVNTHGAAEFGLRPEDIIGRPRATLFAAEVGRRQRENLRTVFETGKPVRVEMRTDFQGREVWLETHLTPLKDDEGRTTAVLGVSRDVTERRRSEEAQRLATVGELAAGVAHEFNNLLASMSLAAEFALGGTSAYDYRRLADVVLQATDRGASVCKNLTAFARPRRPRREPIMLESALEAALALTEARLSAAGVHVERDYSAGGRGILADFRQLEQVFVNLIMNACQAMPEGGTLRIGVEHVPADDGPGAVKATVTDTGSGIAPEHLPRIFEPFFTTRRGAHSNENAGTGLGLSVSRSIVTANDGTIEAWSEQGRGTTFELRFPVCIGEAPSAAAPAPEAAPASGPAPVADGLRVLVAEDAASLRELLVEGLGGKGFAVVPTRNAGQAVAALGDGRFDVVITDLTMPSGGGREVLAAARRLPDPPPVIVITGKIEERVVTELLAQGACVCLRKPFRFDTLLEAIQECVEGRQGA